MITTEYAIEGDELVFLDSVYDAQTQKLFLKMYNTRNKQLYRLEDRSCFKPFFYIKKEGLEMTKLNEFMGAMKGAFEVTETKVYDGIENKRIDVYQFNASNVYLCYKKWHRELGVPRQYEYNIKAHESYYYSKQLVPCGIYKMQNGMLYDIEQKLPPRANKVLQDLISDVDYNSQKYRYTLAENTFILSQPVPDMRRCAIDIEVMGEEGVIPNPDTAQYPIVMVSFYDNEGNKEVIVSSAHYKETGFKDEFDFHLTRVKDEVTLIEWLFERLNRYPVIITYNGDDFDLPYINQRSKVLGMDQSKNPIVYNVADKNKKTNNSFAYRKDPANLKNGIHLDLYRMFSNKSLHTYAFNRKYEQFKLDIVAKAFLNEGKVEHGKMSEMSMIEMATYCLKDAEITMKLTQFNDNMVMKLLFTIARITKATLEDICRYGMSNWVRSMLYFEHRKQNFLIPNKDELQLKTSDPEAIKLYQDYGNNSIDIAKKYEGGFVMEPTPGAHFNVVVLDFASLYPSIIKTRNLSYETINCTHEDCKNNNKVPETTNWYCNKIQGMTSLIIGTLRDLRVEYFKKLSKDKSLTEEERDLYDAITQSQKVILNGSYGVIGQSSFQLFCLPVAESVTAIGRNIIKSTKKYAEEQLGLKVLYGDTDSVFILAPTDEKVDRLIKFTKSNYHIDLEVDKKYKFIIFSALKKNYFGILDNGKIETKGLSAKKSHIPEYIKKCYNEVTNILKDANTPLQLETSKDSITELVQKYIKDLKSGNYEMKDLAFHIKLRGTLEDYGEEVEEVDDIFGNTQKVRKGVPEHIRISEELKQQGVEISKGDYISFIKCKTRAMTIDKAKKDMIDIDKYLTTFETALKPILSVLGIDVKEAISGGSKQMSLADMFFK